MSFFELYYLLLEAVCLTASLRFLASDPEKAWRHQRWYLSIVVFNEAAATLWTHAKNTPNEWMHNIYLPCIPLFLGLLIHRLINELKPTKRYWLYAWWLSIGIALIVESVHNASIHTYNTHTRLYINIGISVACGYYFLLTMTVQRYRSLLTSANVWWMYATFSYYFGHIVIIQMSDVIGETYELVFGVHLHSFLFFFLLTLLYGLWSYAFYLRWRSQRLAANS